MKQYVYKIFLVSLLIFCFGNISAQTVTTDRLDYPPGDTVLINGTGWLAGETVTLKVIHVAEGDNDLSPAHQPFTTVADLNGNISSFWIVPPDEDEVGATLLLTADGQTSGLHAEVTFTDATKTDTYPTTYNTFTGGATYCFNASASNLNVTWNTTTCLGTGSGSNTNVPITITWFKNTTGLTSGGFPVQTTSTTAGTTSSSYLPHTDTAGTVYYYVKINWIQGQCAPGGTIFTSGTQAVTVTARPTATVDPITQTICPGATIQTIDVTSSTGTFTWTANYPSQTSGTTGASGSIDITGAIYNTSNSAKNVVFSITPTSATCNGSVITATVTVNNGTAINDITATVVPVTQTTCSGAAIQTIDVTSNPLGTFTWTASYPSGTSGTTGLSGNADITGTISNTSNTPKNIVFSITPTSGSCNGSVITSTVTVNPVPTASNINNMVFCNGTSGGTGVNIGSSPSGATITWTNDNTSIGLGASGNGDIPTFTATNTGTSPQVATIVITPHYTNGSITCDGATKTFTMTVNPTGQVNQPANQVVCNNTSTSVTFSTINTGGTTSYSWTNNNTAIGLGANGTGNIASFTATNTGSSPITATIIVTPIFNNSGRNCNGPTKTFTITVNPTPTVVDQTDQVVCNNTSTTAISFSGTGTSYTWANDNTSIGLLGSGTGDIAAFNATNSTALPIAATIVVTPHYLNDGVTCDGPTQSFTITVNPTPTVVDPTDQVVCNNTSTTLVAFSGTGTSYSWTNDNTSIGLLANGTGNIAAFNATNSTALPVVATIVVTPHYLNAGLTCDGPTQTFTMTVNPTPSVVDQTDQVVCNNASTTLVTFSGTGTSYTWANDNTSIGLLANGTGNIAAFTATNSTALPVVATIVVTPHYLNASLNCDGPTESFSITVNPTPTLTSALTATACSNILFNYSPTSGTPGTTFNWTRAAVAGISNVAGSGSGDPNETLINTTGAAINVTYIYTLVANGCTNPTTYSVVVTVNATPSITSNPSDALKCIGESASFSTSATGTGITYQWYKEGVASPLANISGKISGATTATLTISNIAIADAGNYFAVASGACTPSDSSLSAHLMVKSLAVAPTTKQYSDSVKFTAKIYNGSSLLTSNPTASVTFKISDIVVNGALNIPLIVDGSTNDLIAELTRPLVEVPTNPSNGQMSPGTKTVKACFNNITSPLSTCVPTTSLIITQEDARVTYTGSPLVATSSPTATTANVTLSATIQDITATPDAAGDVSYGDIRNAKVVFIVDGVDKPAVNVGLVNPADIKTGTAVLNVTLGLGDHTIGVKVNNYYKRCSSTDNSVVQVYQANGDFITGGGFLTLVNPNGSKAGDVPSKNNFGFNIKYNKGGTNLQGNINAIVRRTEGDGIQHVYQVKGNVMTSLSTNGVANPSPTTPAIATFNGKANIQDITDPLNVISLDANTTLSVIMTDKGEPGNTDEIGITVFNKAGGIWFASSWSGTQTVKQVLGGGNIVVHSSAAVRSAETETETISSDSILVTTAPEISPYNVIIYPNPTDRSKVTMDIQGYDGGKDPVKVYIYDISGKVMYSNVNICQNNCNQVELILDGYTSGTYLIDIIIDGKVYHQKLIVN
jgi:hypothetical protein